jgi:hypothetical protein
LASWYLVLTQERTGIWGRSGKGGDKKALVHDCFGSSRRLDANARIKRQGIITGRGEL